jgi:hypothetical protein
VSELKTDCVTNHGFIKEPRVIEWSLTKCKIDMEGSMHVERMPEDDSPRALRRHIQGLEKKLAMVSLERDDLSRDVEAMCLDSASNTTFNMSSVLNERIFVAGVLMFCDTQGGRVSGVM